MGARRAGPGSVLTATCARGKPGITSKAVSWISFLRKERSNHDTPLPRLSFDVHNRGMEMIDQNDTDKRVRNILAQVKPLAVEFYRLTGKPLGVTGEIAEFVAAELMELKLVAARTVGYDALRGSERIQIKGRAYGKDSHPSQRMSRIKTDAPCDIVMLVLLDIETLDPREIWEAPYAVVIERLNRPGSKARERGALGVTTFKSFARRVWPRD